MRDLFMTNRKIQWRPVTRLALAINQLIDYFVFVFHSFFVALCFTADTLRRTGRHFASTSESNYFVALVGNASRLPVSRIRKR